MTGLQFDWIVPGVRARLPDGRVGEVLRVNLQAGSAALMVQGEPGEWLQGLHKLSPAEPAAPSCRRCGEPVCSDRVGLGTCVQCTGPSGRARNEDEATRLHINRPKWSRTEVRVLACPTCRHRRRMLARFQEWYGWTLVCLSCGETWTDGEMHERPFCPGWRRKSVKAARAVVRELRRRA